MEELKFVIKCFIFTMLMIVLMQVKIGGYSLEAHSFHWLRTSSVSQFIQSTAAGGAMALKNLGTTIKEGIASTVDGFKEGAHAKAVR